MTMTWLCVDARGAVSVDALVNLRSVSCSVKSKSLRNKWDTADLLLHLYSEKAKLLSLFFFFYQTGQPNSSAKRPL